MLGMMTTKYLIERRLKMKREALIEKVRNLFELSASSNEFEARSAALKAQQLMQKYHLEETELASTPEQMVENAVETGMGNKWKYLLSSTIAKNFRVKAYWVGKAKVKFFGYAEDVAVATETYQFLFKQCLSMARKADREARKEYGTADGAGQAFALGFVQGVAKELGKQCTALMVITPKEVEDGYAQKRAELGLHPMNNHYTRRSSQEGNYQNGVYAGQSAVGRRAVEGGNM